MNFLSVENISKRFGERLLFSEVSFGLDKGQKMALVAKNGEGKTTLLKMLEGSDNPDKGEINWRNGLNVAYLKQDPDIDIQVTIREFLYQGDSEQVKAIDEYKKSMENPNNSDQMQKAMEAMDAVGAWDYEAKVNRLLTVFEMDEISMEQQIELCSGGQKKRLALIKLIVDAPDVLLLDEPTNHLDISMIQWLEEYLSKEAITLFMITHDRYFLNNTCNQILELDNGEAFRYNGNYEYYLEKKAEREQIDANSLDKKQNLFRKEIEWMRRAPKARGTKSKARQDQFYDLEKAVKKKGESGEMEMNIKAERMGTKIIEMHHVDKRYDKLIMLDDFSYTFKRKERIGIAGKNGVGKSTFLKILMGIEDVDGGKVVQGETIHFGYYSQTGLQLKEDKRIIEVIKDIAEYIPMEKGRKLTAAQLLERFLFPKEQHYTYASKLSGGEKKRLYLLTILMSNPNFLILDEPTNDLDIKTIRILEDFLMEFPGCLLMVSHDRAFMDRLSEHVFYFKGEGKIKDFPGNYSQLLDSLKQKETEKAIPQKSEAPKNGEAKSSADDSSKKLGYMERREYNNLEKEIDKLESKKAELTQLLTDGNMSADELIDCSKKLGELVDQIDEKSMRWLELSERA